MNTTPTDLKYMEHGQLLTDNATIVDIIHPETGKTALVLDQTIFYPQGGGQPYDQGTIQKLHDSATFVVDEVRFKDGIVSHMGAVTAGTFNVHDNVILNVNQERRLLNSRNHTAGHLVDCAMHMLGIHLTPASGYHYPEGAYVEYHGIMEEDERAQLIPKLQAAVNDLIAHALPITIKMVSLEELKQLAKFVPEYIPADKPSRAMIVEGYPAIPCGGTHVQNTKDVGRMIIEKIANKKGNLRVSYSLGQ